MGHSAGVITAPVNTDDVSETIGVASHDVGTLCSAASQINMWARNKPEAIGGPEGLTDAQRKANNFGIRVPTTYTSVQSYINAINHVSGAKLEGWTYDCPDEGDWFRLTDFVNYRHGAVSPFPSLMQGDYVFAQSSSGTKTLDIVLAPGYEGATGSTDYLRVSDFNKTDANYSEWYAGVLLISENSDYYLSTSESSISNSLRIQFNTNNGMVLPDEDAHQAYVFLANKAFSACSAGSLAVSGLQLIPITRTPVDINIITDSSALIVTCAIQSQKIAVTVTNKNASAVVITPVEFQRSSTGTDSNASTLTPLETLEAFTVAAGSAASPTIVVKTYSAPVVGASGFIRLVYKYKIGSGNTSANQTTPWTTIISSSLG